MLSCLTATAVVNRTSSGPQRLQCVEFEIPNMYLFRVSKFNTMSAMKRPMSPKMPPLAPTTTVQLLSKQALKKLPAGRGQQKWPVWVTQDASSTRQQLSIGRSQAVRLGHHRTTMHAADISFCSLLCIVSGCAGSG